MLLIVSFFPISDADSLVTHLNLPLRIFLYGAYPDNLDYVEFVLGKWLLKVKYQVLLRLVGRGDIIYDNDRSYS